MQDSGRLPQPLRVVSILAFVFPFAGLAYSSFALVAWWSSSQAPLDSVRVGVISFNLIVLSLDCSSAIVIYRARLHQPDRGPFLLNSWQRRMRVIAVVAALSICTLVLAVVLPLTALAFMYVLPIYNLVALGVLIVTLGVTLGVTRRMNTGR
jgi:hypothetical protein